MHKPRPDGPRESLFSSPAPLLRKYSLVSTGDPLRPVRAGGHADRTTALRIPRRPARRNTDSARRPSRGVIGTNADNWRKPHGNAQDPRLRRLVWLAAGHQARARRPFGDARVPRAHGGP